MVVGARAAARAGRSAIGWGPPWAGPGVHVGPSGYRLAPHRRHLHRHPSAKRRRRRRRPIYLLRSKIPTSNHRANTKRDPKRKCPVISLRQLTQLIIADIIN